MVSPKFIIKWHEEAINELKEIYEYYLDKSEAGAQNIRNEILSKVDRLVKLPEVNYPFERTLGPPFRYIQAKRYNIIHKKNEVQKEIKVLSIFDTKQNPLKLKRIKNRHYGNE